MNRMRSGDMNMMRCWNMNVDMMRCWDMDMVRSWSMYRDNDRGNRNMNRNRYKLWDRGRWGWWRWWIIVLAE